MDLVGRPDKEILSLPGFSKEKKKLASVQISLQKLAKSRSYFETAQCFKQVDC